MEPSESAAFQMFGASCEETGRARAVTQLYIQHGALRPQSHVQTLFHSGLITALSAGYYHPHFAIGLMEALRM